MAGNYNILLYQGTTQVIPIQWKPSGVPAIITGASIKMQVRKSISDSIVQIDLSTDNTKIVITDDLTGIFELHFSPSDTNNIKIGNGVYDIVLTDIGGSIHRVLQGNITIDMGVTK
jgi:hypothetical protein